MTTIGIVRIITVTFLEDDIFEGSIPRECYDNARTETFECDDIEEAVRVFQREGLRFDASGAVWASQPDGSYISDYATGERREVTGYLAEFSREDITAIIERVG